MSADLTSSRSMVYVGSVPWHGQGIALPENCTYDDLVRLGIFYDAGERPVYAAGVPGALPGHRAIVRLDTNRVLSIVGSRYRIIQFSEIADVLMRAIGREAVFETAGTLGADGARGWLLARLPEPIRVKNDRSESYTYFFGHATHDGSGAAAFAPTNVRAVCQNTVSEALALAKSQRVRLAIRHTASAGIKLENAAAAFQQVRVAHERFGALANMLASVRLTEEQVTEVLDATLPLRRKAEEAEEGEETEETGGGKRTEQAREQVLALHERAQGLLPPARGSAWSLLNAYTDFADHYRVSRVTNRQEDAGSARFNSAVFGSGALLKSKAVEAIRRAAGIKLAGDR